MSERTDPTNPETYPYSGYELSLEHFDDLKTEIERLRTDRATVWAWLREPDEIENASLEWLTEWINRRPLAQSQP